MNNRLHLCSLVGFLLLINFTVSAQDFSAVYTFASVTTSTGRIDPTPVPVAEGVLFGSFEAATFTGGTLSTNPNATNRFSFTFLSVSGVTYVSEYSDTLSPSTWTEFDRRSGLGATESVTHTNVPASARYYRVRSFYNGP